MASSKEDGRSSDDSGLLYTVQAPAVALYTMLLLWATMSETWQTTALVICAILSIQYAWALFWYHRARQGQKKAGEVPPSYPTSIPLIGNILPLLWSTGSFSRAATSYNGSLTSTRIPLLGASLYMFQDRETVKEIMRQRSRLTPISIRFVFPAKILFGMPEKQGLDAYMADTSGPLEKPAEGSNIPVDDRVDLLHHQAFQRAFVGPGLAPTILRFRTALRGQFEARCSGVQGWVEVDDLFSLVGKAVSAAMTEAIFGPSLQKLHPDFIDNLWEYDGELPWLVRNTPRWMNPRPHQIRDKIHRQIKDWYKFAREGFHEGSIAPDGDGDPYWGSAMVRHLQKSLAETGKHSDDAMAAHDLGLIWGATSNAASAAALATFHVFSDAQLLQRVKRDLSTHLPECALPDSFDALTTNQLSSPALLPSVYSETLRLYTNVFLMVASPADRDVSFKKWTFPRGSFGLVSPSLTHTDEEFWNTKDGEHPVDRFWADRFLVYPQDPASGPIRPEVRTSRRLNMKGGEEDNQDPDRPRYSTEGLDGSFIPFGGGVGMCPGRFLAKDAVLATISWLSTTYHIEVLTDSLTMDKWRFGLSVGRPRIPIRARIRKRQVVDV